MWSNMMATQKILDDRVVKKHDLDLEELFDKRILALTDEVMEYAKSTKCFKFWSLKGPDPEAERLEEFVDGIHFYMSLANTFEITPDEMLQAQIKAPRIRGMEYGEGLTYYITRALKGITQITCPDLLDYERKEILLVSFSHFWSAGILDGFTARDIENMYYIKNKKNHDRQSSGY